MELTQDPLQGQMVSIDLTLFRKQQPWHRLYVDACAALSWICLLRLQTLVANATQVAKLANNQR